MDNQDQETEDNDFVRSYSEMELVKYKHNFKQNKEEKMSLKIIFWRFILSYYGLLLLFGIIILFLYLIPEYHYSPKIFKSKISNTTLFDSNYNPKIFLHLSDIYLSSQQALKLDSSLLFLYSLLEYNPDLIIITGNIVENNKGKKVFRGCQMLEDWKIYNTSLRNYLSKYNVIDIAGYHDVWAVDSVTSKINNFLDHSFIFNRSNVINDDDFTIKKIKMLDKTFILFNDFKFPTSPPPYGLEPHTTKKQLDLLEKMINELEEDECYILTNNHVDRTCLTKSSKGHTFQKIISNKKVAGIFTGFSSEKDIKIYHHGDESVLEYTSPSIYNNKKSALITYDNGNLIYHSIYIPYPGNQTLFFLSYPVPNEQISSHHIFNLNSFEIRVISFAKEKNIILKIEGDINGKLSYNRNLNNGAFLYSFPVNLPEGTYKIHIYDENNYFCNINTEFTIAQEYKHKKEKSLTNKKFLIGIIFISILFWIYLFIIIIPLKYEITFQVLNDVESYIDGNDNFITNKNLIIIYTLVLGPLLLRKRFHRKYKLIRYFVLISFFYPLVFPIHFFNLINKKIGYVFNCFVLIDSKVKYDNFSLYLISFFYLGIIFSFITAYDGILFLGQKNLIGFFNLLLGTILFLFGIFYSSHLISKSLSIEYLFFSTAFIDFLIVLLLIWLIFIIKTEIKKSN